MMYFFNLFLRLFVLFTFLGISCQDEFSCHGDPQNVECSSLVNNYKKMGYVKTQELSEPVIQKNEFIITVLDKRTSQPIENAICEITYYQSGIVPVESCPEFGYFAHTKRKNYNLISDKFGQINGNGLFTYNDNNDVVVMNVHISGGDKYSLKFFELRFKYNNPNVQVTKYLLDNTYIFDDDE